MIIKPSEQEARATGAERIIRDSDTLFRCYMPGEIVVIPVTPPIVVTRLQFKKALSRVGFRAAFVTAVGAADQDTKDWFADTDTVREDAPELLTIATALSKTPAQVHALMALADTL